MDLVKSCNVLVVADSQQELQLTTMSNTIDAARRLLSQVKHQRQELVASHSSTALPVRQADNVPTGQQDSDNGEGHSRGAN